MTAVADPRRLARVELARREAQRELLRRQVENPLKWVTPPGASAKPHLFEWMPKQREACEKFAPGMFEMPPTYDVFAGGSKGELRTKKIFGYLAGNRAGKTEWAVRIVIGAALGLNPARLHELPQDPRSWPLGPKRLIWPITTTKEKSRETQQRYVWERIPHCLIQGNTSWNSKSGFHNNVLPLVNGTRLVFRSAEQDIRTFEGDPVHLVWPDEAIDLRFILASIKRLADHQGPLIWTSWPSTPELKDVFFERQLDADSPKLPAEEVGYVQAGMADNIYLAPDEVAMQTMLTDPLEVAGRIFGQFAFTEGLVYPMFHELTHVKGETRYPIPDDWTRDEAIDPGWDNPCAVLFTCVDKAGVRGVYDEIYVRHRTVGEIAALIYGARWKHAGKLSAAELEEFLQLTAPLAGDSGGTLAAAATAETRIKTIVDRYRARCGDCSPRRTVVDEYSQQRDQAKPVNFISQLRGFGIVAEPASNQDKPGQRAKVREQLRPLDGIVRLWFAWNCEKLRWEFKHHRMKRKHADLKEYLGDREEVLDGNNHALSCLEYWLATDPQYVPLEKRPAPPGSIMARHQELERKRKASGSWKNLG